MLPKLAKLLTHSQILSKMQVSKMQVSKMQASKMQAGRLRYLNVRMQMGACMGAIYKFCKDS